jgi:translation initiation factor IF-3
MNEKTFYRINDKIKFSPVIVINENGNNLGSMPTYKAKILAISAGLDLVEVSPNSRPPVCKIMDFGKFKYQQEIKTKKQAKKQVQIKEVRLSSVIEDHDLETKSKLTKKFLSAGHKVQVRLEFKRRQADHKDLGFAVVNKFLESLKEESLLSKKPALDGKFINCLLEPLK